MSGAIALCPGLVCRTTGPMPPLAVSIENQVAALWQQALGARPRLFNGVVFCADRITPHAIDGHWTEYRRVLAQMREPGLFEALRIRALAVNGLLECADGLVLGRREPGAIYQPGSWQSPPAGSVERRQETRPGAQAGCEPIDMTLQILAECEEEIGLHARDVVVSQPVVAFEHPGSHIVDIGFLLCTALRFDEVESGWAARGNREYDGLRLLPHLAAANPDDPAHEAVLPTTRALIDCWRDVSANR